jgi:pilus assembly protein Flp/PilA
MKNLFARFIGDTAGTTAIEYGLIGALISVVCIAGMTLTGAGLQGVYAAVTAAIIPALTQ